MLRTTMRGFVISAAFVAARVAAFSQTADDSTTFEVASVRPSPHSNASDQAISGGPGTGNPGRLTFTSCSLQTLMMNAFAIPPNRLDRLSGPVWLRSETFDIVAKVAKGTTQDQALVMLQNLLIERFKLAVHHETKEADGYALTVAKNGPSAKLKTHSGVNTEHGTDNDGFPK